MRCWSSAERPAHKPLPDEDGRRRSVPNAKRTLQLLRIGAFHETGLVLAPDPEHGRRAAALLRFLLLQTTVLIFLAAAHWELARRANFLEWRCQ